MTDTTIRPNFTNAEVGDTVRLRKGTDCKIESIDDLEPKLFLSNGIWYHSANGVAYIDSQYRTSPDDIVELIKKPKEIKRPDLTSAKVGDKVKLRNGKVSSITRFENTNYYGVVEIANGYCYRLNGVLKGFDGTASNPLDIVELIPSITNPYKNLLLTILTTKSESSEFVVIDAAALHDLVKPIQDPNKVSKAFVDLLDGWQGPDISVPASYLKQLVEL